VSAVSGACREPAHRRPGAAPPARCALAAPTFLAPIVEISGSTIALSFAPHPGLLVYRSPRA